MHLIEKIQNHLPQRRMIKLPCVFVGGSKMEEGYVYRYVKFIDVWNLYSEWIIIVEEWWPFKSKFIKKLFKHECLTESILVNQWANQAEICLRSFILIWKGRCNLN